MDFNQKSNKSRRQKKINKKYSWKLLNEHETTSGHDSDGTTGSIGGNRTRESSECSSSATEKSKAPLQKEIANQQIAECEPKLESVEDSTKEIVAVASETRRRSRIRSKTKLNYAHRNNEKISSMLNALLVASLLIISGLASGHYIASHSCSLLLPQRISTSILNRYVSRTIEMYRRIVEENSELRDRIEKLEYNLGITTNGQLSGPHASQIEQFEREILQNLMRVFDKEVSGVIDILRTANPNDILKENKKTDEQSEENNKNVEELVIKVNKEPSEQEREFDNLIEQGKTLQRRLKRKKLLKDENIETGEEKAKNSQENATNKNEPFSHDKERVTDTLPDADYVIAACTSNVNSLSNPIDGVTSGSDISAISDKHKNSYVYNIRKLFEPNVDETVIKDELSTKLIKPTEVAEEESKDKKEIPLETKVTTETEKLKSDEKTSKINDNQLQKNDVDVKQTNKDNALERKIDESYITSSYVEDNKNEIRESKKRPKSRSTERVGRPRRKTKHNRKKCIDYETE